MRVSKPILGSCVNWLLSPRAEARIGPKKKNLQKKKEIEPGYWSYTLREWIGDEFEMENMNGEEIKLDSNQIILGPKFHFLIAVPSSAERFAKAIGLALKGGQPADISFMTGPGTGRVKVRRVDNCIEFTREVDSDSGQELVRVDLTNAKELCQKLECELASKSQ